MGDSRELNPGPPAPEAGIIPLDYCPVDECHKLFQHERDLLPCTKNFRLSAFLQVEISCFRLRAIFTTPVTLRDSNSFGLKDSKLS